MNNETEKKAGFTPSSATYRSYGDTDSGGQEQSTEEKKFDRKKNRPKNHNIWMAVVPVLIIAIFLSGTVMVLYARNNSTGTIIYPDLAHIDDSMKGVYEGELKGTQFGGILGGLPHGRGTWERNDGSVYIGEFKKGLRHGEGTFTWPDGSEYTGEFVEGRMEGSGEMVTADGNVYVGDFKDNKMHGEGKQTSPEGLEQEGKWENGMFIGG